MMDLGRFRARRQRIVPALVVVCVSALLVGVAPGPGIGAQDATDGSEIDVLTASREEVRAAMGALDEQYAAQERAVAAAEAEEAAARTAVDRARARVELARNDVELAREVVAEYAVEAYIRPPASDALRVLSISQADDAAYASSVLKIMADERRKVVDVLVQKQAEADRQQAAADRAVAQADERANAAQVQLIELDKMRAAQQELAQGLDDRLDKALAEAAALAEIDRQMSEELAAQELALREEGPASQVSLASTDSSDTGGGGAPSTDPPAPGTAPTAPPTTRPGAPPTTRPPAPPTTRPSTPTTRPPAPPSGTVTWADVTSVGGIWVHKSIAGNVRNLLNAATAAGLNLRGGGYRDPAGQIATRRANCGPTHYDIYEKPSSQCRPPTARPGRSMHEKGLAIDFTSSGVLITSRSSTAFKWLAANAGRYGLRNLPSEPWHWSTNGN